jgi:hypothetical protein
LAEVGRDDIGIGSVGESARVSACSEVFFALSNEQVVDACAGVVLSFGKSKASGELVRSQCERKKLKHDDGEKECLKKFQRGIFYECLINPVESAQ